MTRIALVVTDVDGTLLTTDKTLTDRAKAAVRRLRQAGIGFTITSSRPTIGMRFLVEPLQITLPMGAFNGSSIVDPEMKVIEQHLLPASATRLRQHSRVCLSRASSRCSALPCAATRLRTAR